MRNSLKRYFSLTLLVIALILPPDINAQSQRVDFNLNNLSNIRVDDATDDQIRQFITRARSSGMSEQDLEAAAISRGMPYSEVLKLRERVSALEQGSEKQTEQPERERRDRPIVPTQEKPLWEDVPKNDTILRAFGLDLFKRTNLSFTPSLNIPTPQNYQLGPGDELLIEVWGASQHIYRLTISAEGQINITNIGPIRVSGLTVEKATDIIINRLTTIYHGIKQPNPTTFAQVSLSNARSIKVTVAGDAYLPGTYTIPAFATAFNALYLAGGPSEIGSFRDIRIIRNGETVRTIDLYDFLLRGKTSQNIRLQDEDLIFIASRKNMVWFSGEVTRPAIYELLDNETIENLIGFSGGFLAHAYSKQLVVNRKTESQLRLLNVGSDLFSSFLLRHGDEIKVDSILNRFENRITVRGAVFREGEFALTEGMTLTDLITLAEGLREDAFTTRVALYRLQHDLRTKVIDINLGSVIDGSSPDIKLQREDMLLISSVLELEEKFTVNVSGQVLTPKDIPWAKNLSLGEAIRMAGGFRDAASTVRIEVARRVRNKEAITQGDRITEIFTFPIDRLLALNDETSAFLLEPFDIVFVRRSPDYHPQTLVTVTGEVAFPGSYAITSKHERISDLVSRAGGLTPDAYAPGATLSRRVERFQRDRLRRVADLEDDEIRIDIESLDAQQQFIGIELETILRNPHGAHDLILMQGDELRIPQLMQTVRLNGALLHPITARFQPNMGLRGYISQAGGFADNAKKSKVYVVYANGSVDRTHSFLGINFYPDVRPGAEIIVPEKPERQARNIQEVLAISSSIASISSIIFLIFSQATQ